MADGAVAATVRPARSSVLRLRGLPFQATETEIEEFFAGFDLKQCQIGKRNGRSTGEAYVQLDTEMAAGQALQELNCKHIGRRYIEIFEASESDLSPGGEGKGVLGYVLRLRGLPYNATRGDVEKFFEPIKIYKGEEGVVFSVTSSGRPTGEAYVEFMSEEAQQDGMKRHKQHMGARYIELFKSTKADLLQALQQNRFYKEQAEKRQWFAHNMSPLPGDNMRSPYSAAPAGGTGGGAGVEDVTKMLQSLTVAPQAFRTGLPNSTSGPYPQHYENPQDAPAGVDATGTYEAKDNYQNYVDPGHYPSGPHMPGTTSFTSPYHGSGGRGRGGTPHQVPPGVQPGQQMGPHELMVMQQHYLMQQHMMQQQQQLGWEVNPATHSSVPRLGSGQPAYPSGYVPMSAPAMQMARAGFPSGPHPYMYPAPQTSPIPSSNHVQGAEVGEANDSGRDISASGGSPHVAGTDLGEV